MAFAERLRSWWDGIIRGLKKRWWWSFLGVPIEFIWELVKQRVLGATNNFIDAHASFEWLLPITLFFQNRLLSGLIIVVAFAVLVVLVLVFHAYLETRPSKHADPDAPFLTLHFPIEDMYSHQLRTDYIFVKNIGKRTALDVQVAGLSKKWGENTYTAEFPRLQMVEPGGSKPVTPRVLRNDEHHPIFSINSRVWFCTLLIGDAPSIKFELKTFHSISLTYTDLVIKKSNSMEIVAKLMSDGPF